MCKTEESCGYSFIVLLRKISLIISLMKDLTWCSSLGLFGLWLQRERCEFSAHRLSSLAGSLPRGSSHMPRELLLHVFFLVSFKAAIVGLPAWCPWTVTPLVLRVMSSKLFSSPCSLYWLPPLSGPRMFYDTLYLQKWEHWTCSNR